MLYENDFVAQKAVLCNDAAHQGELECQVQLLQECDSLTGLLDRSTFIREATVAIECFGVDVLLAVIDLDKLKRDNDHFGHPFGDSYIRTFALCMSKMDTDGCILGRLGGDEFAILYYGERCKSALFKLDSLKNSFQDQNPQLAELGLGGVSIGVCKGKYSPNGFDDLYRRADVSLYVSKEQGRNKTTVYTNYIMQRYDLEYQKELLNYAIDNRRLAPAFQPIALLETGEIVGYQTLVRIRTENGLVVQPSHFYKALRDNRCARKFSKAVMEASLKSWTEVREYLPANAMLSISVTQYDLIDLNFFEHMRLMIEMLEINWQEITIEIVESATLDEDFGIKREVLSEFRKRGAKVSLSNFGDGVVNLSHLRTWSIDALKISKALLEESIKDVSTNNILTCIFDLAEKLGIDVVAEGIDCKETLNNISGRRVAFGQGSLFGRPQNVDALKCLLDSTSLVQDSRKILNG